MKKVLFVFDGSSFSEGAFEFARKLNDVEPILLTGVFLPQVAMASLWNYPDALGVLALPVIDTNDSAYVQKNIAHFEKLCQGNGIDYRVHKDYFDLALNELEKESSFADVMILGSQKFYSGFENVTPDDLLKNALHKMKCPVIIVPEKFDFPKSIVLSYDGSDDALFAIKQFAYLMPGLTQLPTMLVYANTEADEDFPDKIQMEELVARHFSDLTLSKLDLDPKHYFSSWVLEKESTLLVCGSFGRSGISQLFKKSFILDVIEDHRLPVFIAHH